MVEVEFWVTLASGVVAFFSAELGFLGCIWSFDELRLRDNGEGRVRPMLEAEESALGAGTHACWITVSSAGSP